MKNEKRNSSLKGKTKQKKYLYNPFIFALKIFLLNLIIEENISISTNGSIINLVLEGSGNISFLNNSFKYEPSEVLINGIPQNNSCKKFCYFEENINNVTLIYKNKINTTNPMFRNLKNIKEIDLSDFDFSEITSMVDMFNGCSNLEKLKFGYVNSSLVTNMNSLFKNCIKLKSIDLSDFNTTKVESMENMFWGCSGLEKINFGNINTTSLQNMKNLFRDCSILKAVNLTIFDTSQVLDMSLMFSGCTNLRYLDLSNFNTSKVNSTEKMFENCKSLVFINFDLFQLNNSLINKNKIFEGISKSVKYCFKDEETRYFLLGNQTSDCSDDCFIENIKIDINNNSCIKSCNESGYQYEYNCPN